MNYDREDLEMARKLGPGPILLFPLVLLVIGGGLAYLWVGANPPTAANVRIEAFSWEQARDGNTPVRLTVANDNSSGVAEIEVQCTFEGSGGEHLGPIRDKIRYTFVAKHKTSLSTFMSGAVDSRAKTASCSVLNASWW